MMTRRLNFLQQWKHFSSWEKPEGYSFGIKIFNCIEKNQVPLVLQKDQKFATWYTCGPTVYDSSHIGHACCYMKLDIIQRVLRDYFHIDLLTAMNITDLDDKIIKRAQDSERDWRDISRKYEAEFWDDLAKLNIRGPDIKIRVTEHVPKIVSFIEKLMERGNAYVGCDNSVYFKVSSYPHYGKLRKVILDDKTVDHKHSSADFALWKARKQSDEPSWSSPWGEGRPGWHIECSSLASYLFGSTIDFHAGGMDLQFPHHENEDAQSCAFHEKSQWINNWIHCGQLVVKGQTEKMSKSLNNTISIDEMLQNYNSDVFRMACVLSNYRNTMEYGEEMMEMAKFINTKFHSFQVNCENFLAGNIKVDELDSNEVLRKFECIKKDIDTCLKDDFDTAKVIACLSELTKTVNSALSDSTPKESLYGSSYVNVIGPICKFTDNIFKILGFGRSFKSDLGDHSMSQLIDDLLKLRMELRDEAISSKNKDLFVICDQLRDTLKNNGLEIKDYKGGSSWSFNKN